MIEIDSPNERESRIERFLFLYDDIAEQLIYLVNSLFCITEGEIMDIDSDVATERYITMLFVSCEDLPYKIQILSDIATEIKERPTLRDFEFCKRRRWYHSGNTEYEEDANIVEDCFDRFCYYVNGVSDASQDYNIELQEKLSPVIDIKKKAIKEFMGDDRDLSPFLELEKYLSEWFTNVCEDLCQTLIDIFENKPKFQRFFNGCYHDFWERTWMPLNTKIAMADYDVNELAVLKRMEKKKLESNDFFKTYSKAYNPITRKCDYDKFLDLFFNPYEYDESSQLKLIDFFVSVNTIAAYTALLNGEPLPGYEPLIPEEELAAEEEPATEEVEAEVEGESRPQLTKEQKELRKRIDRVLPQINARRHWFSVCKGMMHLKKVPNNNIAMAIDKIKQVFPEGMPKEPNVADLNKLNVQSFMKDVLDWRKDNAPVKGKIFNDYMSIAMTFIDDDE